MAKKRKAPGAGSSKAQPEEDFNKRMRLNIGSYEDVADSDDEFHIGRDKVLLEEAPAQKKARQLREEEAFLQASDEEVLNYQDEDDDEDDFDEDDEDGEDPAQARKNDAGEFSDEGDAESDDEENELNEWGDSKRDYYGADQMETEQDALDEEAEAKRLQKKQLETMTAADYGFDEDEWTGRQDAGAKKTGASQRQTEVLPQITVSDDMGPAERLKLLKSRNPEFEYLSLEFVDVQETVAALKQAREEEGGQTGRTTVKERAACAYLASLAMYFALISSKGNSSGDDSASYISTVVVKNHPIMATLLSARQLWTKVKDLPEEESSDEESDAEYIPSFAADVDVSIVENAVKKPRIRNRKSRAQRTADAAARKVEERRAERMLQAEEDLADLDDLLLRKPSKKAAKKTSKSAPADDEDSDFGEAELTEQQLAEKAAKRKSLRFYTSQIAQKSNKRGAAGRSAGGDDDIPYRERFRDKQARLTAEAARKGRGKADEGADLGGDSDEEDRAQARSIRADAGPDDDDYYQIIASKSAKKKADKEELAAARKEALLNGGRIVETETLGEDGKRKIGYMIEKNKGLTPHRKKDVRNPRVKKKKKYEERKKKLASMKATYKGGEGRGGYGGEATGIKSDLVKSRKL